MCYVITDADDVGSKLEYQGSRIQWGLYEFQTNAENGVSEVYGFQPVSFLQGCLCPQDLDLLSAYMNSHEDECDVLLSLKNLYR